MKFKQKTMEHPAEAGRKDALPQAGEPQGEEETMFLELTQALAAMEEKGALPEGFDLMAACSDRAFAELLLEFPIEAAVRIYAAEQRAANAEQNAKNAAAKRMQQRAALPRMSRAGGAVAAQPDYMSMSAEEFRKLEQQMKQASRMGRTVRI